MRRISTCVIASLFVMISVLQAATVSGFITNKANGQPIIYASVVIKETQQGIITNNKGYYVLTLHKTGSYTLIASQKGFQTLEKQIEVTDQKEAITSDLALTKKAVVMKGLKVTGKTVAEEEKQPEIMVSRNIQTPQEVQDLPQVLEADVFRSLSTMPGVMPVSDYSSGLYVRGGSVDQNLILLDNIDVYNPNHYGGIFSSFNTDALETVELLKGGFPAQYGGRLSSVLNVYNRDGNRKEVHGIFRTSLIASSATIEGPWQSGEQKGSWMGSFRRTYIDCFNKSLHFPDYYFYDGHAKVNWDLSNKDKLSTSMYFGQDHLQMKTGNSTDMQWGNNTVTAQWVHLFNPRFFSHFVVAGSHYASEVTMMGGADNSIYRKNTVNDYTAKGNFSYQQGEQHTLEFGIENKLNQIDFDYQTDEEYDPSKLLIIHLKTLTTDLYCQDSWSPDAFWTIQPGVRLTNYQTVEKNLKASPNANYSKISPRLSIRRRIDSTSSLYANYGKYYQFLSTVALGHGAPFDIWMPLDGTVKPASSDHYILGYKNDHFKGLGIEIEAYYKSYHHLLDYKEEANYEWNGMTSSMDDVFHKGEGYTYGSDWLLKTDWQGIKGFVGYSYCVAKKKVDGINVNPQTQQERYFYPEYDRTHRINIVENYYFTENTGIQILNGDAKFGLNYSYSTGQPGSKPEKIWLDGNEVEYVYGYKDAERLPAYSRLDLSFKLEYVFKTWSIEPYVQVINVLNRDNVWYRTYSLVENSDGSYSRQKDDSTMFPIIPSIGFNIQW